MHFLPQCTLYCNFISKMLCAHHLFSGFCLIPVRFALLYYKTGFRHLLEDNAFRIVQFLLKPIRYNIYVTISWMMNFCGFLVSYTVDCRYLSSY